MENVPSKFEISDHAKSYTSLTWNVLEYVALFLIVLLPILTVLGMLGRSLVWSGATPNAHGLLRAV